MTLAVEVLLSTLRAGRPIRLPVKRVAGLASHLSDDEIDCLSITPSSVNPTSGLWVVLRLASLAPPTYTVVANLDKGNDGQPKPGRGQG